MGIEQIFKKEDLIKVVRRENNQKRGYLYVNPIQGKHVPVSPKFSLQLFSLLAQKVKKRYFNEKILLIGFAETATAIGNAIAYEVPNVSYFLNTTREIIPNAEYIFFTESHSHATEQRLVVNNFEKIIPLIDRIVFAEDEVTTGNTIEKLMHKIFEKYSVKSMKFGIVSVLNSMTEKRMKEFEDNGIICDFLYRIPTQYKIAEIRNHTYEPLEREVIDKYEGVPEEIKIGNYWNSRIVIEADTMRKLCHEFLKETLCRVRVLGKYLKILVLGTEEFMFPAMLLGRELEKLYPNVEIKFHATTRSPIEVSLDKDYILHSRLPLASLYEEERKTFIYNLERYDKVFVVTDALNINEKGKKSLIGTLEHLGNTDITVIKWGEKF